MFDFSDHRLWPDDDLVAIDSIEFECNIFIFIFFTLWKMVFHISTDILANQFFRIGEVNVLLCYSSGLACAAVDVARHIAFWTLDIVWTVSPCSTTTHGMNV